MDPRHEFKTASRAAYQQHRLLPLGLARRGQIGGFLAALAGDGFSLADRRTNCLWLPADEAIAWEIGAALHRGPHPGYSDIVADRVDRIRRHATAQGSLDARAAIIRLRRLQRALARILAGEGRPLLRLNRRDPMRLFDDYSYLDGAIDRLAALAQVEAALPPPFSGDG